MAKIAFYSQSVSSRPCLSSDRHDTLLQYSVPFQWLTAALLFGCSCLSSVTRLHPG